MRVSDGGEQCTKQASIGLHGRLVTLSASTGAAPTHSKAAQALCDGYCTLVALGVTRDAALQLGVRMDACQDAQDESDEDSSSNLYTVANSAGGLFQISKV